MLKGKQPQKKIDLPEGWFHRLEDLCRQRWAQPATDEKTKQSRIAPIDIYDFTKIHRRSFSTARRHDQMTEQLFAKLAVNVGFDRYDDLLLALQPSKIVEPTPKPDLPVTSSVTKKMRRAEELLDDGKGDEARALMREALEAAREARNDEDEAEALIALALSSSPRRGKGDRDHYYRQLETKEESLKTPAVRALFFRTKASFLLDQGDKIGAAAAFESALGELEGVPEDEGKSNGTQACVTRADYIHLLCSLDRLDKAEALLKPCEEYARSHTELRDGALLQLALQAGIHLALERQRYVEALERIAELESSAFTARLADRIGGDLLNTANQCSQRDAHGVALAAAQASIRLGRRAQGREGPSFLVGAFYTEAMVLLRAGDEALALSKAEALLDFCTKPNDAPVKRAAYHLIAEIKRLSGNPEVAVDLARETLRTSDGDLEETAFAKLALARSLADNGQTEEALKHAREGWLVIDGSSLPPQASLDFLGQIVSYACQLGLEDEAREAILALDRIPVTTDEIADEVARILGRADAITKMRDRITEVAAGDGCLDDDPAGQCADVQDGNAAILAPLLDWWSNVSDASPATVSGAYEFWGRGNFVRVMANLRRFPSSLNVTLEVRTLLDVERAIRMWAMYADVLILLWKGPMESAWEQILVPETFFNEPGGHGYMVFLGTKLKKEGSASPWFTSLGYGTMLPHDVAKFLATEARAFVDTGRLLVVPAVGAACISPGHGVFEQLVAQAANAVPGIRTRSKERTPIGAIPYSPDIPLPVLADLVVKESDRLRRLRTLLLRRARHLTTGIEAIRDADNLRFEIEDAIADTDDFSGSFFGKRGAHRASEPLATIRAQFQSDKTRSGSTLSDQPFSPILTLESLGYGWQVEPTQQNGFVRRYEPQEGDAIGTWLAPAERGWSIPAIRKRDTP